PTDVVSELDFVHMYISQSHSLRLAIFLCGYCSPLSSDSSIVLFLPSIDCLLFIKFKHPLTKPLKIPISTKKTT
ncbi:hypothetical protein ABJZ22_19870, partial [Vibrio parahaemolyticus]|uniref:hypothetical protein n=1 Tax=Vibrio parahaemolyticus TaxID=670 RepID=UPI001E47F09B